jgi:hypothetical protein
MQIEFSTTAYIVVFLCKNKIADLRKRSVSFLPQRHGVPHMRDYTEFTERYFEISVIFFNEIEKLCASVVILFFDTS